MSNIMFDGVIPYWNQTVCETWGISRLAEIRSIVDDRHGCIVYCGFQTVGCMFVGGGRFDKTMGENGVQGIPWDIARGRGNWNGLET